MMTASGRKALSSDNGNGNGENNNNNNSSLQKASKPLMEKRRRARINESLTELKKIVVSLADKNVNPAKLEKADILEMTVSYLRDLCEKCEFQRGHTWRDGFDDCLRKTTQFLETAGHANLSNDISLHLEEHCTKELEHSGSSSETEPINLAIHNGITRADTFVWRPW